MIIVLHLGRAELELLERGLWMQLVEVTCLVVLFHLELETTIQILSDITIKIYRLIKILSNSTSSINWVTGITRQALV